MARRPKLLLLGGTGEARALAGQLSAGNLVQVISSLAGRTEQPLLPDGDVRRGGFGGADGLRSFIQSESIDAVIDATHPFALQITCHARAACAAAGVPLLRLHRQPWQPQPGDSWHSVTSAKAAAAQLPARGRRVFLSIGRQDIAAFAERPGVWYLLRSVDSPTGDMRALPGHHLQARGPFELDGEIELLRGYDIDCLVARNSGGNATYAKLAAARALSLPVIMIARAPEQDGETVSDVSGAMRWIADKFGAMG